MYTMSSYLVVINSFLVWACEKQPCQNEGKCINGNSHNNYTCECKFGWKGFHCEYRK